MDAPEINQPTKNKLTIDNVQMIFNADTRITIKIFGAGNEGNMSGE